MSLERRPLNKSFRDQRDEGLEKILDDRGNRKIIRFSTSAVWYWAVSYWMQTVAENCSVSLMVYVWRHYARFCMSFLVSWCVWDVCLLSLLLLSLSVESKLWFFDGNSSLSSVCSVLCYVQGRLFGTSNVCGVLARPDGSSARSDSLPSTAAGRGHWPVCDKTRRWRLGVWAALSIDHTSSVPHHLMLLC